jgi:hypothetical protein
VPDLPGIGLPGCRTLLRAAGPVLITSRGAGRKEHTVTKARSRIRRMLPLLLLVAFIAWIIVVIVLITLHPNPGSGNPMD